MSDPHHNDNLRGIGWLMFSVVTASAMSIAVRELSAALDSRMIVFLRGAGLTLVIAALALHPGFRAQLRFSRKGMHIARGTVIAMSTHLGYYTLTKLPIATATVLFFTAPIFATVLAVFVHGERVGPRRVAAVAAGFVGAVIILRPGFSGFHPAMLTALGSSALFAVALVTSRGLAQADGPVATFASANIMMALLSLPIAAPVLDLPATPYMIAIAAILLLTAGSRSFADIQAYRFAEAAVLAPLTYLRLVILGTAGYLLWGEVPDVPTLVGAAVIIGASLYIARREAVLRRRK